MSRHSAYTEHFARALLDPGLRPELFEGGAARVDAGLAVYRNNVLHSLTVALADIYPVVRALVGEAFFSGLARAYIRAEPPGSPVLAEYGSSFPIFLEKFEPARHAPYLPDVARIERAWLDAWHAPDAGPLSAQALAAVPPEEYAAAVFTCHPSLACVASPWPVRTIWEAHQQEGEIPEIDLRQGAEETLIARPALDVHVHAAPPGTADLLRALQAGRTLAQAMEIAAARQESFDAGASLGVLIHAEAFTDFRTDTRTENGGEDE